MAECPDLAAQIRQAEAELAAAQKVERSTKAEVSSAKRAPEKGEFRTFSMADGTKVRVNAMEFWKDVDQTMIDMGEEQVRKLVQSNFDKDVVPNGSKGLNINYSQMEFNEETVNSLLEVMGARRKKTANGQELMMPFTAEVAQDEMAGFIALKGGNVDEIARDMARNQKTYARLPLDMVMSKMMRQDSTRHLADQLADYAELVDTVGVSPLKKREIARTAQYAYFFEKLDALLARKVGQALNARKFDMSTWDELYPLTLQELNYDDLALTMDKITEGSLAAQILEAIEAGDSKQLKQVALAKRLDATKNTPLDESNFYTQVRLLNSYRKANLFSSPATWIQRNVVSGALVNSSYMMEDVYEGAFRVGIGDSFKAAQYAQAQTYQGMSAAFNNAWDMLTTGDATMTRSGLIEGVDANDLSKRKDAAASNLNASWDAVINTEGDVGAANGVAVFNLLNSSARSVLGNLIERATGGRSTAGYSPSFTLLAAGDEVNRKMAFDWKASHESYIQAVEEANAMPDIPGKRSEWIATRANELTEQASFSGLMTDDQLVEMRRGLGARQYGDMDNEALRLKIFNDQSGMPNPNNPIGAKGLSRGGDVTFTNPLRGPVAGGIQQMRKNPLVGWLIPVFQTPAQGLKWTLSRDLLVALADTAMRETRQGVAKAKGRAVNDLPYTAQEMAQGRARAVNAGFIALATQALWQAGVFTDGGSFNQENRRVSNSQIPPYSFSIGTNTVLGLSKLMQGTAEQAVSTWKAVIPAMSIDLVDLMGLQADTMRAWSEGLLTEGDYTRLMGGLTESYMRALEAKSSLDGVLSVLQLFLQRDQMTLGKVLQRQMNGVLPYSGLLTSGSRGFQDENMLSAGRRQLTPVEAEAIGQDPAATLFNDFAQTVAKNMPLLGEPGAKFRHRDWMGRERYKPFGLPVDVAQPFAPYFIEEQPLDQWMKKHGLGGVPNPNGRLSGKELGSGFSATMTRDEENTYREAMWSQQGIAPVESVLGVGNTYINTGLQQYNVNNFVQGRTLREALTALSVDPAYNADLATPNSPSLMQNMHKAIGDRSLAKRTDMRSGSDPRGVYKVYDAIIDYYSALGAQVMVSQHPDFTKKVMANSVQRQEAAIEDLQASPLGLSRQ